jgi:hypothetical protein
VIIHRLHRFRKIALGVPGRTSPEHHPQITQISEDSFMYPAQGPGRELSQICENLCHLWRKPEVESTDYTDFRRLAGDPFLFPNGRLPLTICVICEICG